MNTNSAVASSNLNPQERKRILRILESNWQAEMRGRETYATLAERETDLQRTKAFRTLADAEQRHAELWAGRYSALGGTPLTYERGGRRPVYTGSSRDSGRLQLPGGSGS